MKSVLINALLPSLYPFCTDFNECTNRNTDYIA
jgi:hypothetical protein